MNRGRTKLSWVLAGVLFIALAVAHGQPSTKRGRPVIFSDPKSGAAATNLNPVATKKLQSLEDGLKLDILDLADPTRREAAIPPPNVPPPNVNSKQLRNLIGKNRDWVFKSQQDIEGEYGLTAEQIFKIPKYGKDGKEKKDETPLERFYQRMEASRTAPTNSMKADDPLRPNRKDSELERRNEDRRDDERRRTGTGENASNFGTSAEQTLKRLTGRGTDAIDSNKPRTLADLFSVDEADSPAALRAQKQQELHLERFKQLLDPNAAPSSPIVTFGTAPASPGFLMPKGFGTLAGPQNPVISAPPTPSGLIRPLGLPETPRLPDLNSPLKPEAPPATVAPTPAFGLPKRNF